uniref:RING-type E3 ubiquitin transferase n=1 Tax=Davidia involucrata TaxID=16924 RepID=A0A5B7A7F4_DAVIN
MSNCSRLIIHLRSPHGIIHVHLLLLLLLAATPYSTEQSSTDSSQYPYGFDDKISPSMGIIVVVLLCAFFFMGLFAIYIRQCTENTAAVTSRSPAATADGLSRRPPSGLDPAFIESFPVFVYSEVKDIKIGKGTLECAVCLSEFEGDENLRLLPKCDHVFHPECIDTWFASHTTCPVCRADLTLISGEIVGGESNELFADEQLSTRSELSELQDQVSINVENDSKLVEMMNRTSETRTQSRRVTEKFPRSHSTGHSLVQPRENCERYTLRLPEELRKQMMMSQKKLKRTTSCIVVLPREGSSRRGYRSGGEGSSGGRRVGWSDLVGKSDRWVFTMMPSVFTRSLKVCSDENVTAVGTSTVVFNVCEDAGGLSFREG